MPISTNPPAVTVSWTHPVPNMRFEVWTSGDLKVWTLSTNTAARAVTFPAGKAAEYFRVRAVDTNGVHSAWATTTP